MKKSFVLFAILALTFVGCHNDITKIPTDGDLYYIYAESPNSAGTKTYAQDGDNCLNLYWSDNDQLCVFPKDGDYESYSTYTLYEGAGTSCGKFASKTGTTSNSVIAAYPSGKCVFNGTGQRHLSLPASVNQDYVANGVGNGYISMIASGNPKELQFDAKASVLRVKVKPSSSVNVSYAMVSATGIEKKYSIYKQTDTTFVFTQAVNVSNAVVYNINQTIDTEGLTLNIAVAPGTYNDLCVYLYTEDGNYATIDKTDKTLKINAGKVFVLNDADLTFKPNKVDVSLDGGNTWGDFYELTSIPSDCNLITLKTDDNSFIADGQLSTIQNLLKATNRTDVSVDLSQCKYNSTTFSSLFASFKYIADLKLPYNITTIRASSFHYTGIQNLYIGENVTSIANAFITTRPGVYFIVDDNNPKYCSFEGVLYNKDTTELIHASNCVTGTDYVVRSSVKIISASAFATNLDMKTLTLPESVEYFAASSVYDNGYLSTIIIKNSTKVISLINKSVRDAGRYVAAENRKIIVPANLITDYLSTWAVFTTKTYPYTIEAEGVSSVNPTLGNLKND